MKAIKNIVGLETYVKWVNDIFFNEKKVCGILTEISGDNIIIGIGINLRSVEEFPCELKAIAGALGVSASKRNKLIAEIISEIKNNILLCNPYKTLEYYKEKSLVLNKKISFEKDGKEYTGIVSDINESGNLVIETDNDTIIIRSGEIRISPEDIFG